MEYRLTIDAGKRGCGCALWRAHTLVAAGYTRSEYEGNDELVAAREMASGVRRWVISITCRTDVICALEIEYPQTYAGVASRGDANDLIAIAAVGGALASEFAGTKLSRHLPHEWKGSVKKPSTVKKKYPIKEKVMAHLRPEESVTVDWTRNVRKSWDVADAIGVGLHVLGRFDRERSYPAE